MTVPNQLNLIDDADHSLTVPKSKLAARGLTQEDIFERMVDAIQAFVEARGAEADGLLGEQSPSCRHRPTGRPLFEQNQAPCSPERSSVPPLRAPALNRTPPPAVVAHERQESPMAGQTRALIDELIRLRANQGTGADHFIRAHLILSGIDPDASATDPDDPEQLRMLGKMIEDFRSQGR